MGVSMMMKDIEGCFTIILYPLPVAWKEREWEMGFKKRAEQFIWEAAALAGPFLLADLAQ